MQSRTLVCLWLALVALAACGGKAVTYADTGEEDDSKRSATASSSDGTGGSSSGGRSGSDSGNDSGGDSTRGNATSAVVVVTGAVTTSDGISMTTGGPPIDPGWIPVSPVNGWVSAVDNTVGIQGALWTATDVGSGGNSIIDPASFENSGESICVSGSASQVLNMEYSTYWGAMVGLNLNQVEGESTPEPYDALAHGVTGFGFDLDNLPLQGELRFGVKVYGEATEYCAPVYSTISEFRWEDLWADCWEPNSPITPDPSRIESIHWQVVTNSFSRVDYAFCISNLVALTD